MMRRLFTFAAALSMVLLVLCVGIAVWSGGNHDARHFSRRGHLWAIGRGEGQIVILAMQWPRDEPWVRNELVRRTYRQVSGWHRDYWFFVRGGGRFSFGGNVRDPWGTVATVPSSAPGAFVTLRPWRCLAPLAGLSAVWIVIVIAGRRNRGRRGFPVEGPNSRNKMSPSSGIAGAHSSGQLQARRGGA